MMMLAETFVIGGAMDGYRHLSIAEREDIMVRWKDHEGVNEATERALAGEPVHTVALDRGKEFSDAEGLQGALGAPACFCRPHHSWKRGTNGNTNGLLRDWFPKGASLDDVADDEVQRACDSLNRRPRKRLGRKCPWEVYHRQSLHLL